MWLTYVSMLIGLVDVVERVYKGVSGKGKVKKAAVISAAETIATDIGAVSTGGQKETWKTLGPMVGPFVDAIIRITNTVSQGVVNVDETEAVVNKK